MVPGELAAAGRAAMPALLAIPLLMATAYAAEDGATLRELEMEHLMDEAARAFERSTLAMEAIAADFHYRCLRATGAASLCDCLAEKRPYGLRFEHYVRITSRTKTELGYTRMSDDRRDLVDKVRSVRDECVRAPAPRR